MTAAPRPSDVNRSASLDGCDKPTAAAAATTTTTASPPFNDPKADLIIRSSDNTYFYVHKALLSIVSPVFEGMFEGMLKQPDNNPQELYDDRPCLPVTDDSRHLLCLLSWCDPRCNKPLPSLDNLIMTLSTAHKYGMDLIFARAQKELLAHDFIESEPFEVFAIAIRFRLTGLAKRAAQATLGISLAGCDDSPQFKHITAVALQNLHNYHHKCKMAVKTFLASNLWDEEMKLVAQHLMLGAKGHSHGAEYFSLKKVLVLEDRVSWIPIKYTARWWSDYVEVMMYNLNERPSGFSTPQIQGLISLDDCNLCKKQGYTKLSEITRYVCKTIEEVVAKVRKR